MRLHFSALSLLIAATLTVPLFATVPLNPPPDGSGVPPAGLVNAIPSDCDGTTSYTQAENSWDYTINYTCVFASDDGTIATMTVTQKSSYSLSYVDPYVNFGFPDQDQSGGDLHSLICIVNPFCEYEGLQLLTVNYEKIDEKMVGNVATWNSTYTKTESDVWIYGSVDPDKPAGFIRTPYEGEIAAHEYDVETSSEGSQAFKTGRTDTWAENETSTITQKYDASTNDQITYNELQDYSRQYNDSYNRFLTRIDVDQQGGTYTEVQEDQNGLVSLDQIPFDSPLAPDPAPTDDNAVTQSDGAGDTVAPPDAPTSDAPTSDVTEEL